MEAHPDFEVLAPIPLNMVCFRYHPEGLNNEDQLNHLNETLLEEINNTGDMYVTHTKIKGKYTIRFVAGQTYMEERHVKEAWDLIQKKTRELF